MSYTSFTIAAQCSAGPHILDSAHVLVGEEQTKLFPGYMPAYRCNIVHAVHNARGKAQ